ncbi:MAG: hypothetical protein ABFD16_09360, partial [Thermoguttaceae bacterium]
IDIFGGLAEDGAIWKGALRYADAQSRWGLARVVATSVIRTTRGVNLISIVHPSYRICPPRAGWY